MQKVYQKLPLLLLLGTMFTYTACSKDDETTAPVLSKPLLEGVAPAEGTIGTEIAIKGADFSENAKVFIGTVESAKVERQDAMNLYAIVPAGIPLDVLLPVKVINADGGEVQLDNAFKTIVPDLDFVNSATKPSGNIGSTVILEGNAFGDVQGEGKVYFTNSAGALLESGLIAAEDWTNTFIVTTVPAGAVDGEVKIKTASGMSNALQFDVTDGAAFSPSQISWKLATAMPLAVSNHSAVHATIDDVAGLTNQYVYVTGGKSTETQNQVLVGQIGATASVAAWLPVTALPVATSSHVSVAATPFNSKVSGAGFLYVLGGIDAGGNVLSTVSAAPLNQDGTIGAWRTETALPQPLHSMGVTMFRGSIYVAGGATTGNTTVNKVYRAQVGTDGHLSAWEELTALPAARAYHGFVSFGGYLYAVGGETAAVTPESHSATSSSLGNVVAAKINLRTGKITDTGWTEVSSMSKARSKHTTLVAGGALFVSSGLYAGQAGSSENTYASFLENGAMSSFSGATGSNTIRATGGNHLYNQAGVSYVDANGGLHVMIIGGDDVTAPGTKQADVIYY